ncbi:MAG TPA: response regulator transcription factor [bacterium]|nr:response regulator transcription factor [bacterium]HPM59989.1 response regulator transcription factor [bacterium]
MTTHRIMIADDHAVLRDGLRLLLSSYPQFEVIGEADDGMTAVSTALQLKPDVLLLDIAMPNMRGIEAILELKRFEPEIKILVLSMHDREEYVLQAMKNGADGYILKKSAAAELVAALNHVISGEIYLSPSISRHLVRNWLRDEESMAGVSRADTELSERERTVLKLIAEGRSNKEVASLLHISAKTVETHRARIMSKLELRTVPDLVRYAIKSGLVDL